jgi:hypothetical protein
MSKSDTRLRHVTRSTVNGSHRDVPAGGAWTVDAHVQMFAPTGNISLLDMRHLHAGWSLRIKQPVQEMTASSSSTLIEIPWEHVLDKKKSEEMIVALHRLMQMDGSPDPCEGLQASETSSQVSRRLLRNFFASPACDAKPELLFACALLAEKQVRENPGPVFEGVLDASSTSELLHEAVTTVQRFSHHFRWIHDVVEECGDLGIPLMWGAFGGQTSAGTQSSLSLFCDAVMEQRVREDVSTIKTLKAEFDDVWAQEGQLPRTLLPNDDTNLFGTVPEVLRYVAWIRSRWVCYLTTDEHDGAMSKSSTKKTKKVVKEMGSAKKCTSSARNRSSFAVCPLIEKLNHHSESLICPTIDAGISVSVIVDQTIRGDAAAPNQLRNAGDELFITYGGHTNAYLLEHYGFLITPSHANAAEALLLALPAPNAALLDRWCVASDSLVQQWRFTPPHRPVDPAERSSAIASSTVPVEVLFSVAVSTCLELLEGWGLVLPPPLMPETKSSYSEECPEDGGCFHLGGLGEGDSDDSDLDGAGASWYYDAERMRRFLAKKDLEIFTKLSSSTADADAVDLITPAAPRSAVVQALVDMGTLFDATRPLTSLALAELEKLVQQGVTIPAASLLERVSQWKSTAATKEMSKRVEGHPCSLFWATTYADERRLIGAEMLNTIMRHRHDSKVAH